MRRKNTPAPESALFSLQKGVARLTQSRLRSIDRFVAPYDNRKPKLSPFLKDKQSVSLSGFSYPVLEVRHMEAKPNLFFAKRVQERHRVGAPGYREKDRVTAQTAVSLQVAPQLFFKIVHVPQATTLAISTQLPRHTIRHQAVKPRDMPRF
ncbi:MAG: hypothetical protein R3B54_11065 [Bdellovibrionota bacterium]